jgi:hypothetical protein
MRRPLLLALVLLATSAATASGQGGINLFWDRCYADGGATQALFDCSTNTGTGVLIASVILPADLPQFAAALVTIDVWVADGLIPPWWQVASGQCRADAVTVSYDPNGFPEIQNCSPIWDSVVPSQLLAIQSGLWGPSMFRVISVAGVPVGWELSKLADGAELVVCRLIVSHTKSVGTDACEGCRSGACFWLREIKLMQPAGVGDFTVSSQAVNIVVGHNAEGYMSAPGPTCTTPTLNRTWGAIKTLYR